MMTIWVEYWPNPVQDTNYYAQSKKVTWQPPDPKDIRKRFCQSRIEREHRNDERNQIITS